MATQAVEIRINRFDEKEWSGFVESHPQNTIFQTPDFYRFYENIPTYTPYVFLAYREKELSGVLLAVVIRENNGPLGFFSARTIIYGGPLIVEDDQNQVLSALLDALVGTLKSKCVFFQFRNFFSWTEEQKQVFKNYGFVFRDRLNLIIETREKEKVWSGIRPARRRQIRKGLASGACITEAKTETEVRQLYLLLRNLYRDKIRKPLPAWEFFREFFRMSRKKKLGVVLLIKQDEQIIGGVVAPVTPGKNIYEWYVIGRDREFKSSYPSALSTWAPIEFALNNGLQFFDFMGLGVPHKNYGVREFKKRFGGQLVNYGRFGRRNNKFVYGLAEFGYNLLRSIRNV